MNGRKDLCVCGHTDDAHYFDPQTCKRWACTGLYCDCTYYRIEREHDTPLLPPNNYDESRTAAGGGRPHIECQCPKCWEWEYDQIARQLKGWT